MTLLTTTRVLFASVACLLTASAANAATWKVDTAKSLIGFSGTQTGQAFQGSFSNYTATIDFDPAAPEQGHALIVIDLASATSGDPQRDQALPGEDWFDVAQFPKATFEGQHFVAKGGDAYEVTGTLSLRNVSREITMPFTLDIKDGIAHATGHVDLLRNVFGVGQNAWATDAYVGFPVEVKIDLVATPEHQP